MDQAVILKKQFISNKEIDTNESASCGVFYYEPLDDEQRSHRGILIATIELNSKGSDDIDLSELLKKVYANLQENYYHNDKGTLEALEASVNGAREYGNTLSQNKVNVKAGAIALWAKSILYANQQLMPIGIRRMHEFIEFDHPPIGTEYLKDSDLIIVSTSADFQQNIQPLLRDKQELNNSQFIELFQEDKPGRDSSNDNIIPSKLSSILLITRVVKVPGDEEIIEIHYPEDFHKKDSPIGAVFERAIIPFIRKCKGLIPQRLTKPTIYIKKKNVSKRRRLIALTSVMILLLTSVYITYSTNTKKEEADKYQTLITRIHENLSKAEQLTSLNPNESLSIIENTEKELGQVAGVRINKDEDISKIQEGINRIRRKIYRFTEIEVIPRESREEIAPKVLSVDGTGVKDINATLLVPGNANWQNPISVEKYLDNIYVLDPPASAIWKYIPVGAGYNGPFQYINDQSTLQGAIDMAIDGGIYVLYKNKVDYFMLGKKESFTLRGVFPQFTAQSRITTSPSSEYLFVSTPDGIAVFNKDGKFVSLLTNQVFVDLQDMYLSESGDTLWITTTSGWFTINPVLE